MKSVLREPLFHFLALGSTLFLCFAWMGGGGGSSRISVTPGQIEHLASGFTRTWQRPPMEDELKGLIDEYVKEEMATREAIAMGLDRDDTIIRRRLRQKLEFLVEDAVHPASLSEAEMQAWLDEHPEAFRGEPRVAFRQVYVNTGTGEAAASDAEKLLSRLRSMGAGADISDLGDGTMLPRELPLSPLSDVARVFGSDFAEKVEKFEPGAWRGPVESPYGLHLVLVLENVPASPRALTEVAPLVEREILAERRAAELDLFYERLLEKYAVTVEMPEETDEERTAARGGEGSR